MGKEELIIKLLVEDLKFHQLTLALKPLNLSHEYGLDLATIIAQLMLSDQHPSNDWLDVYTRYMNRADECHFWNNMALDHMARKCYLELLNV